MLAQLSQSGSDLGRAHRETIAVFLVLGGFTVVRMLFWTNTNVVSDETPARKPSKPSWLLRPSNLLVLLCLLICIYGALQDPPFGSGNLFEAIGLIACAALIIRHWENDALRKVDVSDVLDENADKTKAPPKKR